MLRVDRRLSTIGSKSFEAERGEIRDMGTHKEDWTWVCLSTGVHLVMKDARYPEKTAHNHYMLSNEVSIAYI